MRLEEYRAALMSNTNNWGAMPPADQVLPSTSLTCDICASTTTMERTVITPSRKGPNKVLSCEGWNIQSLLSNNKNFHHVPRISASAPDLSQFIAANYDNKGVPLVIEGFDLLDGWRHDCFTLDWFRDNSDVKGAFGCY